MAARVVIAGSALLLWAWLRREPLDLRRTWRRYLVQGFLGAALPFALIAAAEVRLSASVGAILNSTSPLFSVFVAWLWAGRPLRPRQVVGAVVGIIGVAILVGVNEVAVDALFLLAVIASLAAAFSYSLAANYAKERLAGSRPLDISVGQLLAAAIWLTPPALLTVPSTPPSTDAVLSLLALALLSTTFASLIYFRLIARGGATKAMAVTFLIPISGVFLGALVLGEPVGPGLLAGLVTILLGVGLVLEIGRRAPAATVAAAD
jgi:drug/metabolite transporter (DMT)-like permease